MLNSEKSADVVYSLQNIFLQDSFHEEGDLEKIESLRAHKDPGIRFWARKVYNKFFASLVSKDSAEKQHSLEQAVDTEILHKKLLNVQESTFMAISVMEQILKKAEPQSLPFLISHLKAVKDPFQISFLAKHLCFAFPSDELLNTITPFLKHSDDRVVANVIEGIERLRTEKGIPYCSEMLRHKNQRVRANAAKALFHFNREKTYKALAGMLRTREEPHHVLAACFAVRELKEPRFLPILAENLSSRILFEDTLTAIRAIDSVEAREIITTKYQEFRVFEKRLAEVLGEIRIEESAKNPWFKTYQIAKYLIITSFVVAVIWYFYFPSPQRKAKYKLAELSMPHTIKSLSEAMHSQNEEHVALLITAGLDPMSALEDGTPLFHKAIHIGNISIFQSLRDAVQALNRDKSPEETVNLISSLKNPSGETILHVAARTGATEFLRYLFDSGFDDEIRDDDGNTLLHSAVKGSQEEVLVFLLTQKLKVDERNKRGLTPLHMAVMEGKSRIVYWLMQLGRANPNLMTSNGMSAIDLGLGTLYSED